VREGAAEHALFGEGNGPIDAFVHALNRHFDLAIRILDYDEHAVGGGADATAVCFVELRAAESISDNTAVMGAGMHQNILTASLNAITSALNRAIRDRVISLRKTPVQAGSVPA
jgi:2-isopropylmalate synthase